MPLRRPEPGTFVIVARQRNDGYAYALFERSHLSKAGSDKPDGAELDRLCDKFRVDSI